jgi:hypothetical protein
MMSSKGSVIAVVLLFGAALLPILVDAQGGFDVVFANTSNIPSQEPAAYSCTFRNNWSAANHPQLYPGENAHWSPPVLATHNLDYQMWAQGDFASPGIEQVAETGSTAILRAELALADESIGSFVVGITAFNSEQQEQSFDDLLVDANHTVLSSVTMIAPSPDWFSGFDDFDLVDTSTSTATWLASFILETYPFDAGTETGEEYSTSNVPEGPPLSIDEISISNPLSTGVFLSPDNSTVLPVAQWECSLVTTSAPPTPSPASCKVTFEPCTSSSDCCSGICDQRLLLAGQSGKCRSAPKFSRMKLSGETRGGAAGAEAVSVGKIPFGNRKRRLIRGA